MLRRTKVFSGSFLSGTSPKSNFKATQILLRCLLLSDANILSMKYQLNSKTGTMKILEQSICDFMQINTVSVLEF